MLRILTPISATWLDYPNASDNAVIVCMVGCDNHCKGCQNPELKNFNYNVNVTEYTDEEFVEFILDRAKREHTDKLVLSGGDPLSCFNIKATKHILELLKDKMDICIYSGHSIQYVKDNNVTGFKYVKCGYFDIDHKQESLKTDEYIQFASPNQALYDENYTKLSEDGRFYFN